MPAPRSRRASPSAQGALITDVVPGSPADRAQLAPGMLVVEANRKPVRSAKELAAAIRAAPAGSTLLLRVAGARWRQPRSCAP